MTDQSFLQGVLARPGDAPAGAYEKECANRFCRRTYMARQNGDAYCNEKCDAMINKRFHATREWART